jgi:hypothetical protein
VIIIGIGVLLLPKWPARSLTTIALTASCFITALGILHGPWTLQNAPNEWFLYAIACGLAAAVILTLRVTDYLPVVSIKSRANRVRIMPWLSGAVAACIALAVVSTVAPRDAHLYALGAFIGVVVLVFVVRTCWNS